MATAGSEPAPYPAAVRSSAQGSKDPEVVGEDPAEEGLLGKEKAQHPPHEMCSGLRPSRVSAEASDVPPQSSSALAGQGLCAGGKRFLQLF